MNLKEFISSEYAQELASIIKKREPKAKPTEIKKALEVSYRQLEYGGYFRRNKRQDLINNSCKEMWEFVDACK
tara:strand:+ start:712 stop:930 length:219 start_codon:yes stop_codon:yes gene_type:complete